MAELADALDSGSSARKGVEVRVLLTAPYLINDKSCEARLFLFFKYFRLAKKSTDRMTCGVFNTGIYYDGVIVDWRNICSCEK